jgi:hypothetical protein
MYTGVQHDVHFRIATQRVPLMEQELLTLRINLVWHLIVSGIRVGQSLVSCVVLSTVVFLYFFIPNSLKYSAPLRCIFTCSHNVDLLCKFNGLLILANLVNGFGLL